MELLTTAAQVPGGIWQQFEFGKTNISGAKEKAQALVSANTKATRDAEKKLAEVTNALHELGWPTHTKATLTRYERLHELENRLRQAKQQRAQLSVKSKYDSVDKRVAVFVKYRMDRAIGRMLTAGHEFNLEELVGSVDNGAPSNYILPCGETPLSLLVLRRGNKLIPALGALGADPDQLNVDGMTPLMLAVLDNGRLCAQAVIDAGGKPDTAVGFGPGEDATPLMIAVIQGNVDMVDTLLAKGANPNARNSKGRTALMAGTRFTQLATTKRLLGSKVRPDPLVRDGSGFTAADWLRAAALERILRQAREEVSDDRPDSLKVGAEAAHYEGGQLGLDETMSTLFDGRVTLGRIETEMMDALRDAAADMQKAGERVAGKMTGKGHGARRGSVADLAKDVGQRRGSVISNVRALVAKAGTDGLSALMQGPSTGLVRRADIATAFVDDADEEDGGIVPDTRTWARAPYAQARVNRASVPVPDKGATNSLVDLSKMRSGAEVDAEIADAGKADWSGAVGGVKADAATTILAKSARGDPGAAMRDMKKRAGMDEEVKAPGGHNSVPLLLAADPGKVARGVASASIVVNPTRDSDPIAHLLHGATFPLAALIGNAKGKKQSYHEELVAHAALMAPGSAGVFAQFGEQEMFRKALVMYQNRLLRQTPEQTLHRAEADLDPFHPDDTLGYTPSKGPCGACSRVGVQATVRCLNCAQNQCARCTLYIHRQHGFRHHRVKPLLPEGLTEGVILNRQRKRRQGIPIEDPRSPSLSEDDPQYLTVVRRLARIVRTRTHGTGTEVMNVAPPPLPEGASTVIVKRDLGSLDSGVQRAPKRGVYNRWVPHLLTDERQPEHLRAHKAAGLEFVVDEQPEYIGPPASVVAKLVALYPTSAAWLGIPVKRVKPLLAPPPVAVLSKPTPDRKQHEGAGELPLAVPDGVGSSILTATPFAAPVSSPSAAPKARRASVAEQILGRRASLVGAARPADHPAAAASVPGDTALGSSAGDAALQARRGSVLSGGVPPSTTSVAGAGEAGSGNSGARRASILVAAAAASGVEGFARTRRASVVAPGLAAASSAAASAGARNTHATTTGHSSPAKVASLSSEEAETEVRAASVAAKAVQEAKAAAGVAEEERMHRVRAERRRSVQEHAKGINAKAVIDARVANEMAALHPEEAALELAMAAQRRGSTLGAAAAPVSGARRSSVAGGRRASATMLQLDATWEMDAEQKASRKKAQRLHQAELSRKTASLFTNMPEVAMAEFLGAAGRWNEAEASMQAACTHAKDKVARGDPAAAALVFARHAALNLRRSAAAGEDSSSALSVAEESLVLACQWCNLGCGILLFPADAIPERATKYATMEPSHPAAAFTCAVSAALLLAKGEVGLALDIIGMFSRAALQQTVGWPLSASPRWCAYALAQDPELLPGSAPVPGVDGLGLYDVLQRCISSVERTAMKAEDGRWGRFGAFRRASVQGDMDKAFKGRRGSIMLGEAIGVKVKPGSVMREGTGLYQIVVRAEAGELDLILSETRWSAMLRKFAMASGGDKEMVSDLDFLLAVQQYKLISSAEIRKRGGLQMKDRYLAVTASLPSVSQEAKNAALAVLRNDAGSVAAFDEPAKQVHLKLSVLLLPKFLGSSKGGRYMDERVLAVGLPSWSLPQIARLCEPDRAAQAVWVQRVVRGWIKRVKGARARGQTVVRGRIVAPVKQARAAKPAAVATTSTSTGLTKGKAIMWKAEEAGADSQASRDSTAAASAQGDGPTAPTPDGGREEEEDDEWTDGQATPLTGPDTAAAAVSASGGQDVLWDEASACYVDRTLGFAMDGSGFWWDPSGRTPGWLYYDEASGAYAPAADGTAAAAEAAREERGAWPVEQRRAWAAVRVQTFTRGCLARKRVAALVNPRFAPLLDAESGVYYYMKLNGTGDSTWTLPRYLPYSRVSFKALCDSCGVNGSVEYCPDCETGACRVCKALHPDTDGAPHARILLPPAGVAVCIECDKRVGYRECEQCSCSYCPACWPKIHSKGNRVKHTWRAAHG